MSNLDLGHMMACLAAYHGRPLKIMEVCGTHTATAFKGGIRGMLSPGLLLISGPGCPVCLAASAYVDKLCVFARSGDHIVASFGDLLKVKGTNGSLLDAKAQGGSVEMIYSPMDALKIAVAYPEKTVVMAAIGFETTAPAYALMLKTAIETGIGNIRLLTALKRLIPALEALCLTDGVDAFIAPGHVAAIIGSEVFRPVATRFCKPFAVTGFTPENMLMAIYLLVRRVEMGSACVDNLYGEVVRPEGNLKALGVIAEFFTPGDAYWRGLSVIPDSGLYLQGAYAKFDAGSVGLYDATADQRGCRCSEVLTGRVEPKDCPLFGKTCTPENAYGPCMVSNEGACGIWFREGG